MQISGRYFDGKTSQAWDATVQVIGQNLLLSYQNKSSLEKNFNLNHIELEPRLGETARVMKLPDGSRFEFEHTGNEKIDQFFGSQNKNWLYKLETHLPLALSLSVLMVLFLLALYFWGIPHGSKWVAPLVPKKITEVISKQSENFLVKTKVIEPTELEDEWLEPLKVKLESTAKNVMTQPVVFTFHKSRLGPNAFALPNGHIFILDDLVKAATTDDQLIAIALHEMAHVYYQHGLQSLVQDAALTVILFTFTGAIDVTQLPLVVMLNAYSRDFESQADQFAIKKLIELNKSPLALAEAFKVLKKKTPNQVELEWLSTHPNIDQRINDIESKYKAR